MTYFGRTSSGLTMLLLLLISCSDQSVKAFNAEPIAEILSHQDGDEVGVGELLSLRGAVSDPDHASAELSGTWLLDGEVLCEGALPDDDGLVVCEAEVLEGSDTVDLVLEVRDPLDAAGSDTLSLSVCGQRWYRDRDGDGFGDPEGAVSDCEPPAGTVDEAGDCDDSDEDVNPEAEELCEDVVDNDCDESVDESCLGTNCFDDPDVIAALDYYTTLGSLRDGDALDAGERLFDDYEFEVEAGAELAAHAWSQELDTRLQLFDSDCELYDESGEGARDTNAFLRFRIPDAGIWTLVVVGEASADAGQYVLELLDDSAELGGNCALDTETIDLLSEPWGGRFEGTLDGGDQLFPESVGRNHYFDDVEVYSFYGDQLTATLDASDFDPVMNLYGPTCGLVTYDTNSGDGSSALIDRETERTGIYTFTPWGEYSNSQGDYVLNVSAGW